MLMLEVWRRGHLTDRQRHPLLAFLVLYFSTTSWGVLKLSSQNAPAKWAYRSENKDGTCDEPHSAQHVSLGSYNGKALLKCWSHDRASTVAATLTLLTCCWWLDLNISECDSSLHNPWFHWPSLQSLWAFAFLSLSSYKGCSWSGFFILWKDWLDVQMQLPDAASGPCWDSSGLSEKKLRETSHQTLTVSSVSAPVFILDLSGLFMFLQNSLNTTSWGSILFADIFVFFKDMYILAI